MELLKDSSSSDSDSKSELSMSTAVTSSSPDSVSLISTISSSTDSTDSESTSSKSLSVQKSPPTCYFNPSTCQRQSFSIPEKIVFYIAKNCANPTTFQKLIESCKYFFKVNPVIVVQVLVNDNGIWYACYYDVDGKHRCEINGLKNVKIWIQQKVHK